MTELFCSILPPILNVILLTLGLSVANFGPFISATSGVDALMNGEYFISIYARLEISG
jgi:hypothetical protein